MVSAAPSTSAAPYSSESNGPTVTHNSQNLQEGGQVNDLATKAIGSSISTPSSLSTHDFVEVIPQSQDIIEANKAIEADIELIESFKDLESRYMARFGHGLAEKNETWKLLENCSEFSQEMIRFIMELEICLERNRSALPTIKGCIEKLRINIQNLNAFKNEFVFLEEKLKGAEEKIPAHREFFQGFVDSWATKISRYETVIHEAHVIAQRLLESREGSQEEKSSEEQKALSEAFDFSFSLRAEGPEFAPSELLSKFNKIKTQMEGLIKFITKQLEKEKADASSEAAALKRKMLKIQMVDKTIMTSSGLVLQTKMNDLNKALDVLGKAQKERKDKSKNIDTHVKASQALILELQPCYAQLKDEIINTETVRQKLAKCTTTFQEEQEAAKRTLNSEESSASIPPTESVAETACPTNNGEISPVDNRKIPMPGKYFPSANQAICFARNVGKEFTHLDIEGLEVPANEVLMLLRILAEACPNLEVLKINVGKVSNAADLAPLAALKGLKHLLIRYETISDSAIQYIAGLEALEELELECSPTSRGYTGCLTDEVFTYFSGLKNLKHFHIAKNLNITGSGLVHLAGLEHLESLHFNVCPQLSDQGLSHILGFKSLQKLVLEVDDLYSSEITNNYITDETLGHISHVHGLKHVVLNNCLITDEGLEHLAHLQDLEVLDLSRSSITDEGLEHLAALKGLKRLNLSHCPLITDEGMPHLAQIQGLQVLDLKECKITDKGMNHVGQLTSLEELSIADCPIGDPSLAHIAALKDLKILVMSGCDITGFGLLHIIGLKSLEKLDISSCKKIVDIDLLPIRFLSGLKELNMGYLKVTGRGFVALTKLEMLEKLDLSYCEKLVDVSLRHISEIKGLKKFKMSNSNCVSIVGFNCLICLKQLEVLDLHFLAGLSSQCVLAILEANPLLNTFNLYGSGGQNGYRNDDRRFLLNKYPFLKF